jgi:hypothetical protein
VVGILLESKALTFGEKVRTRKVRKGKLLTPVFSIACRRSESEAVAPATSKARRFEESILISSTLHWTIVYAISRKERDLLLYRLVDLVHVGQI